MFRRILLSGVIAGLLAGLVAAAVQQVSIVPLIRTAERQEAAIAPGRNVGTKKAWSPAEGIERMSYSLLASLLAGIGFGLILAAGLALHGRVDLRRGLLWGLGGYAAWSLAPALGLPPALPGAAEAALVPRQAWWLATALATSTGLALLAFARSPGWRLAGLIPIALPHLIGAPAPPLQSGDVPADAATHFIIASLATTGLFWLVLGSTAAAVYRRLR